MASNAEVVSSNPIDTIRLFFYKLLAAILWDYLIGDFSFVESAVVITTRQTSSMDDIMFHLIARHRRFRSTWPFPTWPFPTWPFPMLGLGLGSGLELGLGIGLGLGLRVRVRVRVRFRIRVREVASWETATWETATWT